MITDAGAVGGIGMAARGRFIMMAAKSSLTISADVYWIDLISTGGRIQVRRPRLKGAG